ncbi:MAG TPA: sugar phosphate isomerase/epimerase [Clostridiales bacterium]|nr:sugar phosphate isomerase/epimerase [Clostridiales bacterium]
MKYRYGLQLYSVRKDLEKDLQGTLSKVKEMGYEAVEFFGEFKYPAQEVKQVLDNIGLKICGWHTPWHYLQGDQLNETIAYFKDLGNKYVIIPGLPHNLTYSKEAWLSAAEEFNGLSEKLQKHGMKIGYHNHFAELYDMDGEKPFHMFFSNTDSSVIMQVDIGHVLCGGADLMDTIADYAGRAVSVHLKPYKKGCENPHEGYDTMIGDDDIPWAEFMSWCKEHGNTEWYIVEYESEALYAPLEGVQKCLEALRKMENDSCF